MPSDDSKSNSIPTNSSGFLSGLFGESIFDEMFNTTLERKRNN